MKALEKVRARRYPSVAELAADTRRYMEHRPVLASPQGGLYRARKFLRRHRPAVFAAVASLAFILLSGVTVWSFARRDSPPRPKLTDKNTIVLSDFANATGDRVFDGTLRQEMAAELGNSPYLGVLSDARVSQTLRLMVRPQDTKLTPDVAAEICERTGSAAVVEGAITSLGSEYMLSLRARNCRTGDVLDEEHASTAKKDEVFKALGQMVNRFTTGAGRSLPRVEKEPRTAAEATTPSLDAWRSYSAAMREFQARAQSTEAVSLMKRAIEIDPKFALAYAYLSRAHADLGETELAARDVAKAYELRNGVSDREDYFITFTYHRQLTRNLELCRQTLESWTRKYPEDFLPHSFLSGFTSRGTGHYDRAVEEGQKALALDPNFAILYENIGFAYVYLNRSAEAEALLHTASERKIEAVQFSLLRYFIAFLRERHRGNRKGDNATAGEAGRPGIV
jgi:tetratricopeptide (TPR) repeat protein